ncbi:MAG: glycosyltransferase [Verrucomicrobia bacterium]|nr:glycosyltransferase [Verrucomicrobiota bacterium]
MPAEPRPGPDFRVRGRPLKLGIIASELFDPKLTGIGGFGWATKQVSRCFSDDPQLGVESVLLMTRPVNSTEASATLHGSRILWRAPKFSDHLHRLRAERFDLLLAIDNQAVFRLFTWALPRTPVIFWIRDPWPPADKAEMATLRIPGDDTPPQGLHSRDLRNFRFDWRASRLLGRRMLFAMPAKLVEKKIPATYGFAPPRVTYLPNIINLDADGIAKTPAPTVVVVGRLDPVKRPWIAVAVAERMPGVEFLFLGQNHFTGPGSWQPKNLPPNVKLLGHTDGARKTQLLASAWALLNTSIHEGLPVTFQESLACGTPIVSCLDPDDVVKKFGLFTGAALGDGMELVPKFVEALGKLFADAPLRERLARDGRAWVRATHNRENFLATFHQLCREAGVLA